MDILTTWLQIQTASQVASGLPPNVAEVYNSTIRDEHIN